MNQLVFKEFARLEAILMWGWVPLLHHLLSMTVDTDLAQCFIARSLASSESEFLYSC